MLQYDVSRDMHGHQNPKCAKWPRRIVISSGTIIEADKSLKQNSYTAVGNHDEYLF